MHAKIFLAIAAFIIAVVCGLMVAFGNVTHPYSWIGAGLAAAGSGGIFLCIP